MQKILTVSTGILETLCVGDAIFGWSAMNYILTKNGYFGSECHANSSSRNHSQSSPLNICPSQQYQLELVFTLSVVLSSAASIVGGILLDRYGTLFVRNLSVIMFAISCLSIAFSKPKTAWILYPSMIGFATSGFFLYITNIQTANFFPHFRGTIVNLINGALAASLVMFALAKSAYENGISLMAIYISMAFLSLPMLMRSYFLMPKMIVPYNVPNNFRYGLEETCCPKETSSEDEHLLQETLNSENADNTDENSMADMTLKTCLMNVFYILGALTLVIQWLRVNFFLESINVWLHYMLPHKPNVVIKDISIFGYIQLIAFLQAPLNGAIFDAIYCYYCQKQTISTLEAKYKGMAAIFLVSCLASTAYSIFTLINSPMLQYATFVFVITGDVFPPANLSLLLIQCFPMKYFGTLYSGAVLAVAVVTTLQYPLFYIGIHYFGGNFFVVNTILLVLVIATIAEPIILYLHSIKEP